MISFGVFMIISLTVVIINFFIACQEKTVLLPASPQVNTPLAEKEVFFQDKDTILFQEDDAVGGESLDGKPFLLN